MPASAGAPDVGGSSTRESTHGGSGDETVSVEQPVGARFVGQSVARKEDLRLLTGHGTYVDDVSLPGMLHAAFVRSPFARARISGIDTSEARKLAGIHAVLTAEDLAAARPEDLVPTMFAPMLAMIRIPPLRALADGDVRYAGEPVALVVAENRYLAEDACELVEVDYDPLPPVVDFERAAEDRENLVHPELGTNVASQMDSPPEPELAELLRSAPHVVTCTFYQGRQAPLPMETRGLVASWDPFGDGLRVWISSQHSHEVRLAAGRLLRIPEHRIRVSTGDVGGGFGQKMFLAREEACVILACHHLEQPIKWIEDRQENLIAATHARLDRVTVTMALDEEGRILGANVDHLDDTGSFPQYGIPSGGGIGAALGGPYRMPRISSSHISVWTNTCGRGAYRGPWMMETLAREHMMDATARAIGMDPLEFRRRNVIRSDELPFKTASGAVYEDISADKTLEQAAAMVDYEAFRREQAEARKQGRYLGVGLSLYIEPSAMPQLMQGATVRVEPTGKVTVLLGTNSHGQSIETTMAQVVADEMGVAIDDVSVVQGDTGSTPFGSGTGGSTTAVLAGGAARQASAKVREKLIDIAAHLIEAAPRDLEIESGAISVRGTPARQIAVAEVASVAYHERHRLPPDISPGLEATAHFHTSRPCYSNSCHACICEVDVGTGKVKLLRYIVSEDCGVMINPMVVEGQIAGGVAQGIAGALYEHMRYDEDGNPLTATLLDYLPPTAAEIPELEYGHIETPSWAPGGHKGMGEGGAIGAPSAVFNAVADALAPLGVELQRLPLDPNQLFEALEAAGHRLGV